MEGINKPKYGGQYTKKKYWKLKDGEVVFRILPGLGTSEYWSKFYKVHYGYRNTAGQLRPFVSPLVKNNKTKMVEVPDAALERIEKIKAQYEAAKAKGDALAMEKLDKLISQYNLDNNHYVNAIDTQGNIGVLKLRHRAKLALDATIKRLQAEGIDPLGIDSGRFFIFRRSGTGLETTFQVDVLKEKINVPNVGQVEKEVIHVITDEIASRLFTVQKNNGQTTFLFNKEAADLENLFKTPTSEQVARIVAESDILTGKSKAVDEILDTKNNASDSDDSGDYGDEGEDDTSTSSTKTAAPQATVATQAATPPPVATPVQATPAPVVTQAAPAAPVSLGTAPTPTVTADPTKTTAQTVEGMTDDAFLKSIGL